MNQKYAFSSYTIIFLCWLILGVALIHAAHTNIVLIVVDDLGYADLSHSGTATDVKTLNIDRLAKNGVRFTDAYATAPICNASRIALMTGRYQQRQGVKWYTGPGMHRQEFPTIAEVLKKHGYSTGYIGKYHHGTSDTPDGRGFPLNHGFETFFGFAGGTKHYLHHKSSYVKGKDMLHQGPLWDGREQKDVDGFMTELIGTKAIKFLRTQRNEPFYLHLSFSAVHNFTHQLPQDYLTENELDGFQDLKPDEDYWEWRKKIGFPAHPEGRDYYLGQLHYLDIEIGRILDELERLKLEQNTAIIFVSDNGGSLVTYANNHPLKGGKYTLFEGGIRVPMIVSFPKLLKQNSTFNSVASTLDLLPTICSLVDTNIPKGVDGIDLLPALQKDNSQTTNRKYLYWDTGHEAAIRTEKWKLLITSATPNPRLQITDTPIGSFLYDLENDPGETINLASQNPELMKQLTSELEKWQSAVSKN